VAVWCMLLCGWSKSVENVKRNGVPCGKLT
jgi:hypothetical protein